MPTRNIFEDSVFGGTQETAVGPAPSSARMMIPAQGLVSDISFIGWFSVLALGGIDMAAFTLPDKLGSIPAALRLLSANSLALWILSGMTLSLAVLSLVARWKSRGARYHFANLTWMLSVVLWVLASLEVSFGLGARFAPLLKASSDALATQLQTGAPLAGASTSVLAIAIGGAAVALIILFQALQMRRWGHVWFWMGWAFFLGGRALTSSLIALPAVVGFPEWGTYFMSVSPLLLSLAGATLLLTAFADAFVGEAEHVVVDFC